VTKAGAIRVSELFAPRGAVRHPSNAVCPGDIVPGVQATPTGHEEHAERIRRLGACPRQAAFGTGEEVAGLVAWLASDESAHMTGATLRSTAAQARHARADAR
jgi:NAD(P)-dependent dehydrogenase (short-subunit alcohol dehydrogenase family)